MGAYLNTFKWSALFRDGHTIESSADELAAFDALILYLYGSEEDPRKHYLLWFRVYNDDKEFVVSFDKDGDAYIDTPDSMIMTEFKIRSAQLLYERDHSRDTGQTVYKIGFGGINTCGDVDGKTVTIQPDGSYTTANEKPAEYAIIKS